MEEKNNEEIKNEEIKNEEIKNDVEPEVEKKQEGPEVIKEAQPVVNQNFNPSNNQTNTNNVQSNTRNIAVASLVCSLVGLLIFRFPLAIAAIITGVIAYNKEDVQETNSKGLAVAGLVIGIVDIVWAVFGTLSLFSILF